VLRDLLERREAVFLFLREDQPAVEHDFELSARSADQARLDAVRLFDLSRQTGGSGKIVSLNAVGDLEAAHRVSRSGSSIARRVD
jgi:hypothetical protein